MQFVQDKKASASERFFGGKIDSTGLHNGHFLRAYKRLSSDSEAEFIHFDFMSDAGQDASFDICYKKRDGSENEYGIADIQGLIMPLLGVESLKEKLNDVVQLWDVSVGAMADTKVTSYPQLVDKHIGIVFQAEVFKAKKPMKSGEYYGINFNPKKYCDADTKQTANEKINDSAASLIDTYLKTLKDLFIKSDLRDGYLAETGGFIEPEVKNKPDSPKLASDEFDEELPF